MKDEAISLIENHFAEAYPSRETFSLDMDWDMYAKLEDMGLVKIFTARDNDKLVGYLWVILSPNLHSKGTTVASDDGLFVSKEYRGKQVAQDLIRFTEQCLREDGLKVFYISGTHENPIEPLMNRMGYSPIETKYQKVL